MADQVASVGPWRPRLRPLPVSGLTLIGVVLIALLLFSAVFANVIAPYEPNRQNYSAVMQGPSLAHWLGTDQYGRDLLSRLIHGSRVAIGIGFVAIGIAITAGGLLGLTAGYVGRFVDDAIMRMMDALLAFPSVLLALGIMAALGPGVLTIIIAIAIAETPLFARITRAQVLSMRERDFVIAARAMGARPPRVIFRHILPHITGPIIVMGTLQVGHAILTEAALSFLGLGIQPPTASWGATLRNGFAYMERAPWIAGFTGLAILLTVLALNLVGDALRDRLDPRGAASH